jgi:hypothetical protein
MHRAAKTLKNEEPKILLKPRTITYVHTSTRHRFILWRRISIYNYYIAEIIKPLF